MAEKPVLPEVLKSLGEAEESFLTETETRNVTEESGFRVLGTSVSSKEDWELYVRPVYIAMNEIIGSKGKLAEEAREIMKGFEAECAAAGQHWNMLLVVARKQ